MQENQHTKKLKEAMEIYWGNKEKCDTRKRVEAEKYLRLRIRPLMEYLIEQEDLEKIEYVTKKGWFSSWQLDIFLKLAGERHSLSAFVRLLQLKKEICGFQDKSFDL